jgi:hypothetical protein
MRTRLRDGLTFANVMSVVAVFIALGGGAYAALKLPKNSVGPKQLKADAVTPPKVDEATIELFEGQRGPQGPKGDQGDQGPPGTINGVAAGGDLTGTYPSPQIANGAVGTSKFGTIPAARAANGSTPSLPQNTPTALSWDLETYDTQNLFAPPSTFMTIPVSGTYIVTAVASISPSVGCANAPGFIQLHYSGNSGSGFFATENFVFPGCGPVSHTVTGMARLNAGDHVDVIVSQGATTATMYFGSSFAAAWIGP